MTIKISVVKSTEDYCVNNGNTITVTSSAKERTWIELIRGCTVSAVYLCDLLEDELMNTNIALYNAIKITMIPLNAKFISLISLTYEDDGFPTPELRDAWFGLVNGDKDDRLNSLRNVVADEQGFTAVMGPLLGNLIRNGLKTLLDYEEQIIEHGYAIDTKRATSFVHEKTGNTYLCVTDKRVKLEADWNDGVIYRSSDGTTIIRDKEQFYDGRFKEVEKEPR